ncbi:MAG: DUF1738 domain-containing protein [Burkholderiales bacterium]|nr:DUF1738 domain-containing protein [Burkholderiales bacterium]
MKIPGSNGERATARRALTERLIAMATAGVGQWERTWRLIAPGRPFNAVSGHRYEGGNRVQLVLGTDWSSPGWLTERQVRDLGGHLLDVAPTVVEFWKRDDFWTRKQAHVFLDGKPVTVVAQDSRGITVRTVSAEERRVSAAEIESRLSVGVPDASGFSRRAITWAHAQDELSRMVCVNYHVYNLEQCAGIDERRLNRKLREACHGRNVSEDARREQVQIMIDAMRESGLKVVETPSNQPRYSVRSDTAYLPMQSQFKTMGGYVATVAHEIAHSTGAGHRLGRFVGALWGGESDVVESECLAERAREELVAEMAAAMICADLGVEYALTASAGYVGHWLAELKKSENAAYSAARDASAAADFVLGAMEQRMAQRLREAEAQEAVVVAAPPIMAADPAAEAFPSMGM